MSSNNNNRVGTAAQTVRNGILGLLQICPQSSLPIHTIHRHAIYQYVCWKWAKHSAVQFTRVNKLPHVSALCFNYHDFTTFTVHWLITGTFHTMWTKILWWGKDTKKVLWKQNFILFIIPFIMFIMFISCPANCCLPYCVITYRYICRLRW